MSRPLRVLSVRQPFASALFGPKPGENRSWSPNAKMLIAGEWLAIHASVSLFAGARSMVNRWRCPAPEGWQTDEWAMWPESPPLDAMPRNAIIGVVRYAGVMDPATAAMLGDRWANEREVYYWTFSDRRPFATPITPPPAGAMAHAGLWLAPPDVVAAARALGCEVSS